MSPGRYLLEPEMERAGNAARPRAEVVVRNKRAFVVHREAKDLQVEVWT